MNTGDEAARRLRRLAHGAGDVGRERPSTLFAAVVVAGGLPVDIPVQRPSPELIRAWMKDEYNGTLQEGVHYWITPAAFGGL